MPFFKMTAVFISLSALLACAHSEPKAEMRSTAPAVVSPAANESIGSAFDENPQRWRLIADQNGIRIYQDLQAAPGRVGLRAKTEVNASIAKMATALTDFDIRKKWMNGLVENRLIRQVSDFERVEYAKLKVNYPFEYADFVYQSTFSILREPRTLLIRMASVSDSAVPVPVETARGQITNSFNFVKEVDPDHTELVMEMGIDPKGALPSWDSKTEVTTWFNQNIQSFKNTVEDPHFKVSHAIQDYMTVHRL